MNSTDFDLIMVFGEVLFDVFPDQGRFIGGAPFNVACHLKGFGLDPLFISRIGNDDPGREVLGHMDSRGLKISGVQKDDRRKTGEVRVKIDNDEPSYEIMGNVAYDHMETPDEELMDSAKCKLLYHGTLAARNKVSSSTLYDLARDENTSVFCDINLRDPWWSRELIEDILSWCRYIKVNEDELRQVCSLEGISLSAGLEERAENLRRKRDLECLIVTLGSRGAMLFPSDEKHMSFSSPEVKDFQDSVGAGDAFSSVFLMGLTKGWTWAKILERSVFFAARICENKGAIPEDINFYRKTTQNWEHENA